jgi:hypothetical protein
MCGFNRACFGLAHCDAGTEVASGCGLARCCRFMTLRKNLRALRLCRKKMLVLSAVKGLERAGSGCQRWSQAMGCDGRCASLRPNLSRR